MLTAGKNKVLRIVELTVLIGGFTAFVHFLTGGDFGLFSFTAGFLIITTAAAASFVLLKKGEKTAGRLAAVLAAMGAGLWSFSLCRFFGFVDWPMDRAADLGQYISLLISHMIIFASVVLPVVFIARALNAKTLLRFAGPESSRYTMVLTILAGGLWICAAGMMFYMRPAAEGTVWGLAAVGLAKAALTGIGEEICFRGILQQALAERYGSKVAIVIAALLYGAFHIYLGPAFFSKTGFLLIVVTGGLIFGVMTQITRGIGWACIIHTAVDMVIEWQNIS